MKPIFLNIYYFLLENYRPQGWWPLLDYQGINPTKTGSITGYHPSNYDLPQTRLQRFEICIGAILTQNTAWPNVEKALFTLQGQDALHPDRLAEIKIEELLNSIRPAGYFNQKAKKIKIFTDYFLNLGPDQRPTREELMGIWGIGPETADSILLYAFKIPSFVIDAYTKRIFTHLGIIQPTSSYHEIKTLFEENLPQDLIIYQEYHALIVEHAKRFYHRRADYTLCPLLNFYKPVNSLL